MAEASGVKKANVRCLPSVKKGFVLLVFEIPSIKPTFFSKKKAGNAEVDINIPNAPGEFGKVKLKSGTDYLLEAVSDDFGSATQSWSVEDSDYEIVKDEIHVFLKVRLDLEKGLYMEIEDSL